MSMKPTVRVESHLRGSRIFFVDHGDRLRHTISRHGQSGGSTVNPMDDAEMG